jgi:hypothetical protein
METVIQPNQSVQEHEARVAAALASAPQRPPNELEQAIIDIAAAKKQKAASQTRVTAPSTTDAPPWAVDTPKIILPPLTVVDVTKFVHVEIPKKKILLAPFITEKSTGMVHAWRGVGKTHMLLGMAMAQASGGQFLKWNAPEPSSVLYADGEMTDFEMQKALREGMSMEGIPPIEEGRFNLISADLQERGIYSLSTKEGQHLLEDRIGDAQTIYFDNISTLFRGGDERTGEDWEAAQDWLLSLRRQGKATVLAHHDGKGLTQRGTSQREDILNWVIQMQHPKNYQMSENLRAEVHFRKTRGQWGAAATPFEVRLETHNDQSVWTMKDMGDALADAVVRLKQERGMSYSEIGKELGIARSWAQTLYTRAMTEQAEQAKMEEARL